MAHVADLEAAPAPPLVPGPDDIGDDIPLLHDRGQRVDVTMTTIELLQAMTDQLASGSSSMQSTTKNYDWVYLEYLFLQIGAMQVNGSYTGLGAKSLHWRRLGAKRPTLDCSQSSTVVHTTREDQSSTTSFGLPNC
jgi:hypothetical protein